MVVLIVVLAWPRLQGGGGGPTPVVQPAASPVGAAGSTSAVDLNSMTPREAADRLFTRVMRGVSAGDDAEVQSFLPMAIAAYERAVPLDADGMFHMALLQMTGADLAGALATAETALEASPDHLLLLSVAAEAENEAGNDEAAATYYRHILEVWDEQMASGLADYAAHQTMMPEIESNARAFVEGGG
jgi:tetratricopeptide (TPR) repeat protein